jgi:hypothetical protein
VRHQPLAYRASVTIDLDTEAVQLTILHCGYHARCRVRGGSAIATAILPTDTTRTLSMARNRGVAAEVMAGEGTHH